MSKRDDSTHLFPSQEEFRAALREEARLAVQVVIESVMREELTQFLQAEPYQRQKGRTGYRNGGYVRDLVTSAGVLADLRVPRDRAGQFQTQAFERFQRYEPEVSEAIAAMFVAGVSQRRVAEVTQPLLGVAPSASSVSRIAHDLQSACDTWRKRPLLEHYRVIFIDGVYFPIVHGQQADETPLLVAVGIDLEGQKAVIGLMIAGEESADAWQNLLDDLKQRGVRAVDLFVTDGDEGLIGVLERTFAHTLRQRCTNHKMRNVLAKVPKRDKCEVAAALKGIFAQESREEARLQAQAFRARYETSYPEAVTCLERDLEACLTFYHFPKNMWRHIRTTNAIEGLFHTIRQRTNKIGAFRTEQSCTLIVYATIQSIHLNKVAVA